MKNYHFDILILVSLTFAAATASWGILRGMFLSADWFLYPEKFPVVGDFFRYNYYLRRLCGVRGTYFVNCCIVLFLLIIIVNVWRDFFIRYHFI